MQEASSDGCARVGIHPMAFLGRTARLRLFQFQDNLQVGEHEQFFYANRYFGLQAAVCFDSTFPHFRVKMKDGYKKRRERMQEKMTKEFSKIGFPSMMYLLSKYDQLSGADHAEFISQDVPPWHICDDTCGSRPEPPVDFGMFFAVVFSTADARGAQFRGLLRGGTEDADVTWLAKLSEMANVNWAFFLPEVAALNPNIAREEEEYGDLAFLPSNLKEQQHVSIAQPSAEQLKFVVAYLQRFQFRWLVVAQQDSFVSAAALLGSISALERAAPGGQATRAVLGRWSSDDARQTARWLIPEFFAMTQDVYHLLASYRVQRWLRTDFEEARAISAGPTGSAAWSTALNSWLAVLEVSRQELPGVYTGRQPGECPVGAQFLHPVEPDELQLLSAASMQGPPCQVVAEMQQANAGARS